MFSPITVTPARVPRSNGSRPSGSVCEKKPRSRMSALNARASEASPLSAVTAPQPAAARCWFTSARTWPSALVSATPAAGAAAATLVFGAGAGAGAGLGAGAGASVSVSSGAVVVSSGAVVGVSTTGAGAGAGADGATVDDGAAAAACVLRPARVEVSELEPSAAADAASVDSRPSAPRVPVTAGAYDGRTSAMPASTPQTRTTGTISDGRGSRSR